MSDPSAPPTTAFEEFARAHGLRVEPAPELPPQGALLSRDSLSLQAAAQGELADGEQGTVCHLTYTYKSNDSTHTARRTAAVVAVPETIGFAPYLGGGGPPGGPLGLSTNDVELQSDVSVRAAEGIDEGWLAELFSPALSHWLARSPDDFEWELANGVLVVSREGHLDRETELSRLCADAAHLAAALRTESLEEVDSGAAPRSVAKRKRDANQILIDAMLPLVRFERPPADVIEARPRFRELIVRHPSTYFISLFMTIVWMLVVNVVGGGIFGLLLNMPNPGRAVLIFELSLFALIGFLTLRHEINDRSQRLAVEAFWHEYAASRELRPEDPAVFAATHAKAKLPGNPARVFSGRFGEVGGSLMVTGNGFKRGDSIALVAGPTGPVASADFDVSAPGASARALDAYTERLAGELAAAGSR